MTPRLTVEALTVDFGTVRAVDQVSLEAGAGEAVALLGANGAGKSSLLRAVAGATRPLQGRVLLDGHDLAGTVVYRRARAGVVLVPEGRGLLPRLSVTDNLRLAAFGIGLRRSGSVEVRQRIEMALGTFPVLAQRTTQAAGTLSGGEQQMLVIARALMMKPKVLLLDEVSLGLAPTVVEQIYEILAGLVSDGLSMIIVEQYANLALQMAHRAYVLRKGRVVFQSSGTDALANPAALQEAYLGAASSTTERLSPAGVRVGVQRSMPGSDGGGIGRLGLPGGNGRTASNELGGTR
jgi:branched-chain amino acid transport system ATP-binding protein